MVLLLDAESDKLSLCAARYAETGFLVGIFRATVQTASLRCASVGWSTPLVSCHLKAHPGSMDRLCRERCSLLHFYVCSPYDRHPAMQLLRVQSVTLAPLEMTCHLTQCQVTCLTPDIASDVLCLAWVSSKHIRLRLHAGQNFCTLLANLNSCAVRLPCSSLARPKRFCSPWL